METVLDGRRLTHRLGLVAKVQGEEDVKRLTLTGCRSKCPGLFCIKVFHEQVASVNSALSTSLGYYIL